MISPQSIKPAAHALSAEPAPTRRIQLRTLVLIRWIAIAGQALTLLLVDLGLGFEVPLVPALGIVGASVAMNLAVILRFGNGGRLGERAATWHLAFDVLQLAALLYLTGGLRNPFCPLLLAPVTVSASILSGRSTIALCALAIAAASLLAVEHWPLPWDGSPPELPLPYVTGVWAALVCGIGFIATYVARVATDARRMSNALAATQLALSREQRVSSLGTLAAAAAHELGTPLATIAVVARELASDLPAATARNARTRNCCSARRRAAATSSPNWRGAPTRPRRSCAWHWAT